MRCYRVLAQLVSVQGFTPGMSVRPRHTPFHISVKIIGNRLVSKTMVRWFNSNLGCFSEVTGNLVSTNMRTGQNSYFLVAMFTSIIAGMGLVFVLLVSVLRKRLEHTSIGGRIDEMIEIVDDKLYI